MIEFTIERKWEIMRVLGGRLKRSRPMWQADGVTFYVYGTLDNKQYAQAMNLALQQCANMHIPAMALHRYSNSQAGKQGIKTDTKRMKGF